MKARRIFFVSFWMLALALGGGCSRPPSDQIMKALASTNATFYCISPTDKATFSLTLPQIKTVRHVIERFNHPSEVRLEPENMIAPDGYFAFDDVSFGWFGGYLRIEDAKSKQSYIVEDDMLKQMAVTFQKTEGTNLPFHTPSHEQWLEILSVLEKAN